jgi:hypothetical protein
LLSAPHAMLERMFPREELAWAAGFLDAEGHFAAHGTAQVTITQVDVEPLDIFLHTLGVGILKGPYEKSTPTMKRQPQYVYYAYGNRATKVFSLVEPWLGEYRRKQALDRGFPSQRDKQRFGSLPMRERLAWCAGFFEGEGCFNYTRNPGLQTRITHTDRDLLDRFISTIGIGHIYGPYTPHRTSAGKALQYVFSTSGFESMQAILAMLWPWIGSRRRVTAMSLLETYLHLYACGHPREGPWRKYCPLCFKPGPKPGFRRSKPGQLSMEL